MMEGEPDIIRNFPNALIEETRRITKGEVLEKIIAKGKLWIVDCACCRSRETSSTSTSGIQVNGKFLGGAHGVQSNNAQPQKRPRAEDKCLAEGARGGVRAPDSKEKKSQWCGQADASARYFSWRQSCTLSSLTSWNWEPPVACRKGSASEDLEELDNKDPGALVKARELRDVIAELEIGNATNLPPQLWPLQMTPMSMWPCPPRRLKTKVVDKGNEGSEKEEQSAQETCRLQLAIEAAINAALELRGEAYGHRAGVSTQRGWFRVARRGKLLLTKKLPRA